MRRIKLHLSVSHMFQIQFWKHVICLVEKKGLKKWEETQNLVKKRKTHLLKAQKTKGLALEPNTKSKTWRPTCMFLLINMKLKFWLVSKSSIIWAVKHRIREERKSKKFEQIKMCSSSCTWFLDHEKMTWKKLLLWTVDHS